MISFAIWVLLAGGLFAWNYFNGDPYIGIWGSDRLFGHPLNGGWLAVVVAVYTLVRFFVRRRRRSGSGVS